MGNRSEEMKKYYHTSSGQAVELAKRKTPRNRYGHAKCNAKRRGKAFTLSYEEYETLIKKPCKYCGTSIANETGTGLDRIDNDAGYVTGNVNPCCGSCNRIRARSMRADVFEKQSKINRRKKV